MNTLDSERSVVAGEQANSILDAPLESTAIRRIIEEVRTEELSFSRGYNRTYNRHNR